MKKTAKTAAIALPYFIIVLASAFIALRSAFAPQVASPFPVYDQAAFSYTGWVMTKGLVPYLNAWDNKGPLLYFIDFIGLILNKNHGIFFIQWLSVSVCGAFLYKTAKLFAGKTAALVASLYCIILMTGVYALGNSVEEYALPFTAIALFLLTKYVFNDYRLKTPDVVIVGACAAACALMRINLVTPIFAYCAVIFAHSLVVKKYAYAGKYLLLFALGFVLFSVPFVVYLAANGALSACISAAYTMILNTNALGNWEKLANAHKMFECMSGSHGDLLYFWFLGCGTAFLVFGGKRHVKYKLYTGCVMFALLANLPANLITGYGFAHYFLTFPTLLLFPAVCCAEFFFRLISYAAKRMNLDIIGKNSAEFAAVCSLLFAALILVKTDISGNINYILDSRTQNEVHKQLEELVINNTVDGDKIQLYNNLEYAGIYMKTNRLAASEYFYTPFWDSFDDSFRDEIALKVNEDIISEKPKLMLVWYQDRRFDEGLADFAAKNYEILDFPVKGFTVYKLK